MNLNTDLFQEALEIEKSGSISRAAQNLFVSQPNLSASVKKLEISLGYRIFERTSTGVTVTEQGRLFLDSARIIVNELENIKKVPQLLSKDDNSLSIVSVYSVFVLQRFMQFRSRYSTNNPGDLFKETGLLHAIDDLIEKKYRLGFIYEFESLSEQLQETVGKYNLDINLLLADVPILAIMSKEHPLAKLSEITPETLVTKPLVAYEYLKDNDWLGLMGIHNPREIMYVFDRGGMLEIINYGYHIGICVGSPFLSLGTDELVAIPVVDVEDKVNQYWMRPFGYQLSYTEDMFIRYLKMKDTLSRIS